MTLDDAIVAFRQVASDDFDSLELDVRDYERLVMWLTELKLARESAFSDIGLAARATSENHQLKAENAKLRELVRDTLMVISWCTIDCCPSDNKKRELNARARELGIEVDG